MSRYAGSNSGRQSVGDPGHCERCCLVGHVLAHPELGCADVGCATLHGDEEQAREMADLYRRAERDFNNEHGKRSIEQILRVAYGLTGAQALDVIHAWFAVQDENRRTAERKDTGPLEGIMGSTVDGSMMRYTDGQWVDVTAEWLVTQDPNRMKAIKKALNEYARRDTRGLGRESVIRVRLANAGLDVETIEWVMKP